MIGWDSQQIKPLRLIYLGGGKVLRKTQMTINPWIALNFLGVNCSTRVSAARENPDRGQMLVMDPKWGFTGPAEFSRT